MKFSNKLPRFVSARTINWTFSLPSIGFKYKLPTPRSPNCPSFLTNTLHRFENILSSSMTGVNSTFGGSSSSSASSLFSVGGFATFVNVNGAPLKKVFYLSITILVVGKVSLCKRH